MSRDGDYDDGGPEGVHGLNLVSVAEEAIPSTLGHPTLEQLFPKDKDSSALSKEEVDGALIGVSAQQQQSDASVLTPNPKGSTFSSSVSAKFSDSTTNLATLTKAVEDTKFRMDQLQRYLKRRLKCRVDPASCAEASPARAIKPKEECKRRWKYMCRTTFELTPGASQAATGGAAMSQVLFQHSLEIDQPNDLPPHAMDEFAVEKDPMQKLIEKQQHELEDQAATIATLNDMMEKLQISERTKMIDGSIESTGAVRVKDLQLLNNEPAPQSSLEAALVPQPAPAVEQPKTDDAAAAVTDAAPATTSEALNADQQLAQPQEQAAAVDAPAPSTDAAATADDQAPEQASTVASALVPETKTEPEAPAATETAASNEESIGATMNIQLTPAETRRSSVPVPYVDPAVLRDAAIEAAKAKTHVVSQKESLHQQAAKWSQFITTAKPKHKHSYLGHASELNVLAQLDEGLGEGMDESMQSWQTQGLTGMPDEDFIQHLASEAYAASHSGSQMGLQSLVQLEEGPDAVDSRPGLAAVHVDSAAIRALAEAAAASEFPPSRTCVQREAEGPGMCVLFDDGSRCLRTDKNKALCGFVEGKAANGDLKRSFTPVPVSELLA